MSEAEEIVLIGDPNEERFKWFQKLLAEVFERSAEHARTFEDVRRFARDKSRDVSAVFLTDDLPFSDDPSKRAQNVNVHFARLDEILHYADHVCVITKDADPEFAKDERAPHRIHLRTFPLSPEDEARIIDQLDSLPRHLSRFIDPPELKRLRRLTKEPDRRPLRRQIRSLSERYDMEHGLECLLRLIHRCLDCSGITGIEVGLLGQGKSGAAVFRFTVNRRGLAEEYVLKISDALWKLEAEVRGHLKARAKTGLPGYKEHVAALREPVRPFKSTDPAPEERHFIVESGRWYAIHYDFLGGPGFGKFIDLETALTAAPSTLVKKTDGAFPAYRLASVDPGEVLAHRLNIFGTTLEGLCDILYGKSPPGGRKHKAIWKSESVDDKKVTPYFPPYQLTERAKGWVQDFLDSREASIGARMFPRWKTHCESVLGLVSDDAPAGLGALGTDLPFTLSPVHGDLNANNVLLWLEQEKYPFLIDLPFFQEDGHVLQDFARLEVEIKLALLDRQEESPPAELAAYDYADSQVELWIELEDRLHERRALDESELDRSKPDRRRWKAGGFTGNLTLCYKLIMLVRQKSCRIQQRGLDGLPPAPFAAEYLPALLYHTIRAIGYPSLSVFKRLLAVYSAGLILESLDAALSSKPRPR